NGVVSGSLFCVAKPEEVKAPAEVPSVEDTAALPSKALPPNLEKKTKPSASAGAKPAAVKAKPRTVGAPPTKRPASATVGPSRKATSAAETTSKRPSTGVARCSSLTAREVKPKATDVKNPEKKVPLSKPSAKTTLAAARSPSPRTAAGLPPKKSLPVKTEVKAAEVKKMPAKASTAESSRPKSAPVSTTASPAPLGAAASRPKVKPMASKLPGTSGVTPEAKKPSLASKALPKTSLGSKSPRPSTSVSVPDLKNIRSRYSPKKRTTATSSPNVDPRTILSMSLEVQNVPKPASGNKSQPSTNPKPSPGCTNVQIQNKKIDLSKKLNFKEKAQAKVGSLDNVGHVPAGGTVKIQSHKLTFRENAKARTDHGADFAACTGSPSASPPLSTSVSETLGTITAAAMSSLPPRLPWQAPLAEETSAALSRPGFLPPLICHRPPAWASVGLQLNSLSVDPLRYSWTRWDGMTFQAGSPAHLGPPCSHFKFLLICMPGSKCKLRMSPQILDSSRQAT
ncbi:hypothetical protein E2320_001462, partial [Naja naja]